MPHLAGASDGRDSLTSVTATTFIPPSQSRSRLASAWTAPSPRRPNLPSLSKSIGLPASDYDKLGRRESRNGLQHLFSRFRLPQTPLPLPLPPRKLDPTVSAHHSATFPSPAANVIHWPHTLHAARSELILRSPSSLSTSHYQPLVSLSASAMFRSKPSAAAHSPSSSVASRGSLTTWDPPPLFQAYSQAIRHAHLSATTTAADSLLRHAGKLDSQHESHPASKSGKNSRNSSVVSSTSFAAAARLEWTTKIYVLVSSGCLLQYSGDGSYDRLPEKVLHLGPSSAAFASDAIPGRHWVLHIAASLLPNGSQGPAPEARSLISRLSLRSSDRRQATDFLMVFDAPYQMDAWIAILRHEIETLGGKKHLSETGALLIDEQHLCRPHDRDLSPIPSNRDDDPSHRFSRQRTQSGRDSDNRAKEPDHSAARLSPVTTSTNTSTFRSDASAFSFDHNRIDGLASILRDIDLGQVPCAKPQPRPFLLSDKNKTHDNKHEHEQRHQQGQTEQHHQTHPNQQNYSYDPICPSFSSSSASSSLDQLSCTSSIISHDGRQLESLRNSGVNRLSYASSGQPTVITSSGSSPSCSPIRDSFLSMTQPPPTDLAEEDEVMLSRQTPSAVYSASRSQAHRSSSPSSHSAGSRSRRSEAMMTANTAHQSSLPPATTPNFSVPSSLGRRYSLRVNPPSDRNSYTPSTSSLGSDAEVVDRLPARKAPPFLLPTLRPLSPFADSPLFLFEIPVKAASNALPVRQSSLAPSPEGPRKFSSMVGLNDGLKYTARLSPPPSSSASLQAAAQQKQSTSPFARNSSSLQQTILPVDNSRTTTHPRMHVASLMATENEHQVLLHLREQQSAGSGGPMGLAKRRSMPQLVAEGPPSLPPPSRALPPIPPRKPSVGS